MVCGRWLCTYLYTNSHVLVVVVKVVYRSCTGYPVTRKSLQVNFAFTNNNNYWAINFYTKYKTFLHVPEMGAHRPIVVSEPCIWDTNVSIIHLQIAMLFSKKKICDFVLQHVFSKQFSSVVPTNKKYMNSKAAEDYCRVHCLSVALFWQHDFSSSINFIVEGIQSKLKYFFDIIENQQNKMRL